MFMHWTYQGNQITNIPEDVVGFVYMITNTTNGRMYIGKKLPNSREVVHHSKAERTNVDTRSIPIGRTITDQVMT